MKSYLTHILENSAILSSILASSLAAGSPGSHKVVSGDTLSGIAKQNKTTVDDILKSNPNIKDPNKISVGQEIQLGSSRPATTPEPEPKQTVTTEKPTQTAPWKPLISEFEGFKTEAYWDDKGRVWTLGKGSTTHPDGRPVRRGDTISQDQADEYMQHYVDTKVMPRMKKIPNWDRMNSNQQGALVSFAYNVGPGFYGSQNFKTITGALSSPEKWGEVPGALSLYNKSKGEVLPGLTRRRKAEGQLWSSPVK